MNIYRAKLDIKSLRPDFKPKFVQYDTARLEIKFMDGGQPYDMSEANRVEFTHVRKDNVVIIHAGEIVESSGGLIVRYDYQGSEMDVISTVRTSFALFDTDGNKVSSPIFEVTITKDLRNETFSPAEPNCGILQTLVADVKYLKENGGSGGIGPTGPQGPKGDPGDTPVKGIDYFDGVAGQNGIDGKDGIDGEKGDPFSYADFTQSQLEELRGTKGDPGAEGPAGSDANVTNENVISALGYAPTKPSDITAHETSNAPHRYGNKFEWRYNPTTNSLDLVVLD